MSSIFLALLLFAQQLFFLSILNDSFHLPKWMLFSAGFVLIAIWAVVNSYRDQMDLKYPNRIQNLFVFVVLVPILIQGIHFLRESQLIFFHLVGAFSLLYILPYLIHRGLKLPKFFSRVMIYTITGLIIMDWFSLIPIFQGDQYHLSALAGNPNLAATSLLCWYVILAFETQGNEIKLEKLLVFIALGLTLCRAAILGFLIYEILCLYFTTKKSNRMKLIVPAIFGLLILSIVVIKNPMKWEEFSRLSVRWHEVKTSTGIAKRKPLIGIPYGSYRNEYFDQLELQANPDRHHLQAMAFSHDGHLGLMHVFLYLGIPLGLMWVFALIFLIYQVRTALGVHGFCGLFVILAVDQSYYVFKYSLVLVPFFFILAQGLSAQLNPTNKKTAWRFFPLIPLMLWAIFWINEYRLERANSKIANFNDFQALKEQGRLKADRYHLGVQFLLSSNTKFSLSSARVLLEEAHQQYRDPSYYYHLSLIESRSANPDKARQILKRGISVLSSYAPYYYALSLLSENSLEEEKWLGMAIELKHDYFSAWKNYFLIVKSSSEKRKAEALQILDVLRDLSMKGKGSLSLSQLETLRRELESL